MGIFSLDLSKPIDLNIHAEDNLDAVLEILKPYMVIDVHIVIDGSTILVYHIIIGRDEVGEAVSVLAFDLHECVVKGLGRIILETECIAPEW